jgi:hypothetical protein
MMFDPDDAQHVFSHLADVEAAEAGARLHLTIKKPTPAR